MADHVVDELHDFSAGRLVEKDRARIEAHLRTCTECRDEADALDEVAAGMVTAPMAVLSALKKKLEGAGRFDHLIPRLCELFDLSPDAARALLASVDEKSTWVQEMAPGVLLAPVTGGKKVETAFTVLVKLEPGAVFPTHTHGGRERVLILEGGYLDVGGTEFWRGELDVREKGTSHSFTGLPALGCLCAAVMYPVT
jgi:putative transcriptional regulator